MGRAVDRDQAARADPRVGEAATGDLDAGVYSIQHTQVLDIDLYQDRHLDPDHYDDKAA